MAFLPPPRALDFLIAAIDESPGLPIRLAIASDGRIAQLVEQLTLNQRVPGSSPGASTIFSHNFNSSCRRLRMCCATAGILGLTSCWGTADTMTGGNPHCSHPGAMA